MFYVGRPLPIHLFHASLNQLRVEKIKMWNGYGTVVDISTLFLTLIVRGSQLHIWVRGGGTLCPPLVNAVLMAQMSWNFVCDLTWVVSERFHDQKGTIMCQAPGWVQDPKIQKFQEFWNSDIFFNFQEPKSKTLPIEFLVKKWSILM